MKLLSNVFAYCNMHCTVFFFFEIFKRKFSKENFDVVVFLSRYFQPLQAFTNQHKIKYNFQSNITTTQQLWSKPVEEKSPVWCEIVLDSKKLRENDCLCVYIYVCAFAITMFFNSPPYFSLLFRNEQWMATTKTELNSLVPSRDNFNLDLSWPTRTQKQTDLSLIPPPPNT